QATVTIDGQANVLKAGDYGVMKVGTFNGWENDGAGNAPVRWLQMAAPQPKPTGKERDTFFPKNGSLPSTGAPTAAKPLPGHFDATQIPPEDQRPAGLAKGVFLKWMIDEHFGARHHRMLFIEYAPGAAIGLHDHTFEEAYYILEGEVEATLDGQKYLLKPGD